MSGLRLIAPLAAATLAVGAVGAGDYRGGVPIVTEDALLGGSDSQTQDNFGMGVAIDGDVMIVGSVWDAHACDPGEAPVNCRAGSAYIFRRDASGNWVEEAKLTASDAAAGQEFGMFCDIRGDTAVVAAPGAAGQLGIGDVYVFTRDSAGLWTETAKFTGSDVSVGAQFGLSLLYDEDRIYAGSRGALYVFEHDGVEWMETQKLSVSGAGTNNFGMFFDIHDQALVVSSISEDSESGAAYIYGKDESGLWQQEARITSASSAPNDNFGTGVAIEGNRALVSAWNALGSFGAMYEFVRNPDGSWSEVGMFTPAYGEPQFHFGRTLRMIGDFVFVGSTHYPDPSAGFAGAVHVVERVDEGSWVERQRLHASNPQFFALFGFSSIGVDDRSLVVGAVSGTSTEHQSGAAYYFDMSELLGFGCPADLSGDGSVGSADLSILLGSWGKSGSIADLTGDGMVGSADLAALLGQWGPCPE